MSKPNTKFREAIQQEPDPEWDKYVKDVKALLRKFYIKNISEWISKRGNIVKDNDGDAFLTMLATYYDEYRRENTAARLLNDWIMTNDPDSFIDDTSDRGYLSDRKIFVANKPAESKKSESEQVSWVDDFDMTPAAHDRLYNALMKNPKGFTGGDAGYMLAEFVKDHKDLILAKFIQDVTLDLEDSLYAVGNKYEWMEACFDRAVENM